VSTCVQVDRNVLWAEVISFSSRQHSLNCCDLNFLSFQHCMFNTRLCIAMCSVVFVINSVVFLYVGNKNDGKDDNADISKLYCVAIWSVPYVVVVLCDFIQTLFRRA